MATIAVRVGREIKEISGLTKSTTCWDVVLALLKEKQLASETSDSASRNNDTVKSGDHATADSASTSSISKSIKDLAPSYVIVENWRGCEKPIPPRTRILNVWQAWGKEQKHVELSLKKSKHIRFREGGHHHSCNRGGKQPEKENLDPEHYSLHCMSSHQKRKIRRNMRQYQRALMMKQSEDCGVESEDVNAQAEEAEAKSDNKSEKRNGLILSEEKFIDGFLADPDCLIKRTDRAQLISQGTFDREFCKYRRWNRRRHGSSNFRQHRRHQVSHYPYSSQHDKPRSSRRRAKTNSRKYRYSTDDTSSSSSSSESSEDENASDADDEKSVLVDIRSNVPRRNTSFTVGIGGDRYRTANAATDSSTTTSGDSMSSSIGGSTSSETSSGGDYFLPELHRLSYGRAIENAKTVKAAENTSNNKPKKKFILKPALNLIESFRKSNKRKSGKKANQTTEKIPLTPDPKRKAAVQKTEVTQEPKTPPIRRSNEKDQAAEDTVTKSTETKVKADKEDKTTSKIQQSDAGKTECKGTAEDDTDEHECKDEILQSIQSQEIVLRNQRNRLQDTDTQIESIENDIHNLRTEALGKNYVQDAYLSGYVDPDANGTMSNLFSGPSIPVTTPWILESNDAGTLERFVKLSDKIVEMQLKIEEYNRKAEILLQDMQEEVWRVTTLADGAGEERNTATKAAALMLGLSDEDDSSDEENGHELLSVSSWKDNHKKSLDHQKTVGSQTSDSSHIEVETARTELEASLYLSLRLAAEIDEVDCKLGTSDNLIQKKGETLIDCVRDLAMSEEGVPPEIWEEYGELLTAYDIEVSQQRFLDELERSEICIEGVGDTLEVGDVESDTLYIDATSPNPTSHCGNGNTNVLIHPQVALPFHESHRIPTYPANNAHALWTDCQQWRGEPRYNGNMINEPNHTVFAHQRYPNYPQQPPLLSNLPLPTPIGKVNSNDNKNGELRTPGLLPMLPIPGELMSPDHHNDSDYEDLPDLTSMGPPDSSKSSRKLGLLEDNEISNNTDDSGNASAGSTSSFTSSDGSRNSSCDGGSPRPSPMLLDNPGSKPIFGRNGALRGSWKGHFVFPNSFKQTNSHVDQQFQMPPSPLSMNKQRLRKPELPTKPPGLALKKATVIDSKEQEMIMQQQRLIRRNSTGKRKTAVETMNSTSKEVVNSKPTKLKNVSSGLIHPKDNCQAWNRVQVKTYAVDHSQRFNSYDNDSDTGRSSLHSVDSDQVVFSETLV